MKKMLTLLLAFVGTFQLAGCAGFIKTNQVSVEQGVPVPTDRLFAFREQAPNTVAVVVTRDSGFLGGGCYLAIEADRKLVSRMDTGEKVTFFLTPSTHELTVAPDPSGRGLCSVGFEPVTEKYDIKASGSNRFRLSSRQYRRPELEPLLD